MNNINLLDLTEAQLLELEGARLAAVLDKIAGLKMLIKKAEDHAKVLLSEDEESIPGWTLKEGAKVETITDPKACTSALLSLKDGTGEKNLILPNELLDQAKFSVGDIRSLFKLKTGLSAKDCKEQIFQILTEAGALAVKQNAPSLVRSK